MPFLTINGVTVPVALGSASLSYAPVGGELERSPSGELAGGYSTTKREWRMSTTPIPASELDAWTGLIEGKGHSWPFDTGLYSARGRGTSSGTASIVGSGMRWGAGCVSITTGSSVSWNPGLGAYWTLSFWSKDLGVGTWVHWVRRSDGAEWRNGVTVAPGTSVGEVTVTSGQVVLFGADGSDFYIDDVVAMPFAAPDSWAAGFYTRHSASAWTDLPRVLAGGDFCASSIVSRGIVTGSKVIRYSPSGSLTSGHVLEFSLREV